MLGNSIQILVHFNPFAISVANDHYAAVAYAPKAYGSEGVNMYFILMLHLVCLLYGCLNPFGKCWKYFGILYRSFFYAVGSIGI